MCCGPDLTADNWDRKFETIAWLCEFSESKRACPSSAVVMSEATEHWVAPLDVSGCVGNREKGNGAEASVVGRSLSMEARRERRGLISLVDIQIQASIQPRSILGYIYIAYTVIRAGCQVLGAQCGPVQCIDQRSTDA